MKPEIHAAILDVFGVRAAPSVYLIGGGGKTTLMFALAHALAAEGRSVVTTTSTRILYPNATESDRVVMGSDPAGLEDRLRSEFATRRHVTVAASVAGAQERLPRVSIDVPNQSARPKLAGLHIDVLDRIVQARVAEHVLVEADGAAGRSIKAHREYEPVLSNQAGLVIIVIGVDCLGAPMDDRHVHRAALFRRRLGRSEGSVITAEDVAKTVFHPDGYLARISRDSEVLAFVNKVAAPEGLGRARRLAGVLTSRDRGRRVGRVVVGDVRAGVFEEQSPCQSDPERITLPGMPENGGRILILEKPITPIALQELLREGFGDMVKYVVDVRRRTLAIGGGLHADAEQLLLDAGSLQEDLWGANYYPGRGEEGCIELTSLINIRPAQGNPAMEVQNPQLRQQIRDITFALIGRGEAV